MTTLNTGLSTTQTFDQWICKWSDPLLIKTQEVGESIELIYKQHSTYSRTGGIAPYNDTRVFKIVYSCVNGKWNKSEPIFGEIIPAHEEYYEF